MWVMACVALATQSSWPGVFILLKPSLAPFALIGSNRSSWRPLAHERIAYRPARTVRRIPRADRGARLQHRDLAAPADNVCTQPHEGVG